MNARARLLLVLCAAAAALSALPAAAGAAPGPEGTLMQPEGALGCVSAFEEGCTVSPAVEGAFFVSPSPDGRDVYVGGGSFSFGNLGSFRRGPGGALVPVAGSCFTQAGVPMEGCAEQRGLENLADVEAAPDGRHVYVAAQGAFSPDDSTIVTYQRNAETGALIPVAGEDGCVSSAALAGCRTVEQLSNVAALALSPDGAHVYAAQNGTGTGGGVTMLDRNPENGRLTQPGGDLSCTWAAAATPDCRTGDAMDEIWDVAVTADGEHLYAAGQSAGHGTLSRADIQPDGSLVQSGDPADCVTNHASSLDCVEARGMGAGFGAPFGVAVSPDGASVYVSAPGTFSAGDDTLTALDVAGDGTISQPAGAAGCFTPNVDPETDGCGRARALQGVYDIAVNPEGGYVYAASYRGLGNNGGLSVFERNSSGGISPLPDPYGCVTSDVDEAGCTPARAMAGANGLGVSPDGETVYVAAFDAGSVAVLSHQAAPDCSGASTVRVVQGETVNLQLSCREPNAEPQTYQVTSPPSHGTLGPLDPAAGTVAYTADAAYAGADSLRFRSSDGAHLSAGEGTIEIEVVARQTPPPPPPPPPPAGRSQLTILTKGAVRLDKKGRVALKLRCQGDGPACSGALTLTSARKLAARAGKPKRKVRLATGRYSVAVERTATVRLKPSAANRRLIARLKSVPAIAAAKPAGERQSGATARVVLKAAKRKRGR